MRNASVVVLLALVAVLVLSLAVLAADDVPGADLEIAIGGVVLLWGGVVAALVQLGKNVYVGGKQLLDTPRKIWAANLVLGGVGVLVYELIRGAPIGQALLAAGAAVVASSGIFEAAKTAAGKESAPTGTGSTANGDTQRAPT